PAGLVAVGTLLGVVAAEQAILEAVAFADDKRHVGVVAHVLVLDLVVLDQVVDQTTEERDIRAGTNGRVIVGHRGSTGEAWIDHDQPGLVLGLGFGHPAETAGVCFSSVATHYQDQVGVADIRPGVGHGAT